MGSRTSSTEVNQISSYSLYCPIPELLSEGVKPRVKYQAPKNYRSEKMKQQSCWSEISCSTIGSLGGWNRLQGQVQNYPACCVGVVESWFGSTTFSSGTGFLIHENIILTCAHHLYNKPQKKISKEVYFYPARTRDQGKKVQAIQIFFPKEYVEARDPKTEFLWDFGILVVEEKLHQTYGYLGLSFDESSFYKNQQKHLYGYPTKQQEIEMYRYEGQCKLEEGIIKHSFKAEDGVDGGPLLYEKASKAVVVGIHQGNYKQGRGLKLRTEMFEHLKSWIKKKRITVDLRSKWDKKYIKEIKKNDCSQIYEVDLSWNNLQSSSVKFLTKVNWKNLVRLNLSQNLLGKEGIIQLTKGNFHSLTHLNISSNQLENQDIASLVQSEWPLLETLNLGLNRLTADGIKFLVKPPWQLKHIDLSHNEIGKKGVSQLLRSKWKHLESLFLANCNIENEGVYWLTKISWKRLKHIDLSYNNLGDQGAQLIEDSNWNRLQSISLDNNYIHDQGFKVISQMSWILLKKIIAKMNSISSQSLVYLCQNHWKSLQVIDLKWNKVKEEEKEILTKLFKTHFNTLNIFDL